MSYRWSILRSQNQWSSYGRRPQQVNFLASNLCRQSSTCVGTRGLARSQWCKKGRHRSGIDSLDAKVGKSRHLAHTQTSGRHEYCLWSFRAYNKKVNVSFSKNAIRRYKKSILFAFSFSNPLDFSQIEEMAVRFLLSFYQPEFLYLDLPCLIKWLYQICNNYSSFQPEYKMISRAKKWKAEWYAFPIV